jgi:hypothetical protein
VHGSRDRENLHNGFESGHVRQYAALAALLAIA